MHKKPGFITNPCFQILAGNTFYSFHRAGLCLRPYIPIYPLSDKGARGIFELKHWAGLRPRPYKIDVTCCFAGVGIRI